MNEKQGRAILRDIFANAAIGAQVESVSLMEREGATEFAAVKLWNPEQMHSYDRILEILTDPSCPLRVTRERESARYHFIYLAY